MNPKKDMRIQRRGRKGLYSVSYAEAPGWHCTGQRFEADAIAWANLKRDELTVPKVTPPTFRRLAEHFWDDDGAWATLQHQAKRELSFAYLPAMRGRLKNYLMPVFGNMPASEITFRMVQKHILGLGNLKNSSKNKLIDCMKIMFQNWARDGYIKVNPIADMTRLPQSDVAAREVFSIDEIKMLFPMERDELERVWANQAKRKKEYAQLWLSYFVTSLETGKRPAEILALRWEDWDAEEHGFPFTKAIENITGVTKHRTKTGSISASYLSDRGVQELMIWCAVSRNVQPGDLIYSFDGRTPIRTETAAKHLKSVCARAGVEIGSRTPYSMRHTLATRVLESGKLDKSELQFILGHSFNADTVMTSYFHPTRKTIMRMGAGIREKMRDVSGIA